MPNFECAEGGGPGFADRNSRPEQTGGRAINRSRHLPLSAFQLEAQMLNPDAPGKKFNLFAIPTIDRVLDRGCVMHAVVNANVVTALAKKLGDILCSTLSVLPLQPQDQRKRIKDLFDQIGWSLNLTKGLDNFSQEMLKRFQGHTKRHGGFLATRIDFLSQSWTSKSSF